MDRRQAYLSAMGITAWVPRDLPAEAGAIPAIQETPPETVSSQQAPQPAAGDRSMQIDSDAPWLDDAPPCMEELLAPGEETEPPAQSAAGDEISGLSWEALQQRVSECQRCGLHQTRKQSVFGVGDHGADLMIIGEAPGAEEDRQGEPFVGRAGQLLNAMMQAIGLRREQVFIANILKCRPPDNRDPRPDEAAHCQPYLKRQIALVQPRVILSVGRISAQHLLSTQEAVGRLRGRQHEFNGTPLIVTYHPAYLLRSPDQKGKSWQDLQRVKHLLS